MQMMNCARLIDLVYARDALWDPKSNFYHNREMKHLLWTEIAVELGVSRETVRTKWSCLRDSFRRELKKRNDSGLFYKAQWPFFNRMLFLTSAMNSKDCSADQEFYGETNSDAFEMLVNPEILMSSGGTCDNTTGHEGDTDPLRGVRVKEEPTTSEPATSTTPKHRPTIMSMMSDLSKQRFPKTITPGPPHQLEQLSRKRRKLKKIQKKLKKEKERDEDYHFALSLVSSMKKVPDENKLKMRMLVMDTISSFTRHLPDNQDQSTGDNSNLIDGESLSGADMQLVSSQHDRTPPMFTIHKNESDGSHS